MSPPTTTPSNLSRSEPDVPAQPQHHQVFSRFYAGAGVCGAGLGLAVYNHTRPQFNTRGLRLSKLSKIQRRGRYLTSAYLALAFYGAGLMTSERYRNALKYHQPARVSDIVSRPLPAWNENDNVAHSWSEQMFGSVGRRALGLCGFILAINRAEHAGVFSFSTFRRSPFWSGKMMIPLGGALGYYVPGGGVHILMDRLHPAKSLQVVDRPIDPPDQPLAWAAQKLGWSDRYNSSPRGSFAGPRAS